jgi:putative addiction module component (TIGR02574 family)
MIAKSIQELSKSEKILLVQDLWDDISGDPGSRAVTDEEISYVNNRLSEIQATDEKLVSWDDMKAKAARHKNKK